MISINSHLISHIDKTSIELIDLLGKIPTQTHTQTLEGSLKDKIAVDWTEKIVDIDSEPMVTSTEDYKGRKINRWATYKDYKIGYGEDDYKKFKKLVKTVHKSKEINDLVTLGFLEEVMFEWVIQVYSTKQAGKNLSDYIIESVKESLVNQVYCFPVVNLEIASVINIGRVQIKHFTKEDFDQLSESYKGEGESPYEVIREEYQGMVVASLPVHGEPNRGEEIALRECLLAMDVFKICSPTLQVPDLKLNFDIDIRAKQQKEARVIAHPLNSLDPFEVTLKNLSVPIPINPEYRQNIKPYFDVLSSFIKQPKDNELTSLILNAIKNFADALSNNDLNKRIVEIFSVFESLILPSESAPIQDSLVKYGTKIITKDTNERIFLKGLIKEMYGVRSAMVHHGKRKEIDLTKLTNLQIALMRLILNLISMNQTHEKKESIIKEIDDAINKAY